MSYFPKYDKANAEEIMFNFSAEIKSEYKFRQICHPVGYNVIENSQNEVIIQKKDGDLAKCDKDI